MNARYPDARLFSVAANLDNARAPKPAHCKLVPWFRTEMSENDIVARVDAFAERYDPFVVEVLHATNMGLNNAHPVLRLGDDTMLGVLHDSATASLGADEINFLYPEHTDIHYRPHTSLYNQRAQLLHQGDYVLVHELLLLKDVYEVQQVVGRFALRGMVE